MNVPDELPNPLDVPAELFMLAIQIGARYDHDKPRGTQDPSNRLRVILAAVLERHEAMVIEGKRPHQPVIASRHDGMWGVYCDACSDEAQNYTRCKVRDDWPPDVLADPDECPEVGDQ